VSKRQFHTYFHQEPGSKFVTLLEKEVSLKTLQALANQDAHCLDRDEQEPAREQRTSG